MATVYVIGIFVWWVVHIPRAMGDARNYLAGSNAMARVTVEAFHWPLMLLINLWDRLYPPKEMTIEEILKEHSVKDDSEPE